LVSQTYKDIEIICIDDGSTDDSLNIVRQFANSDERIRVATKPNGGLSSARNVGLSLAKGSILMFVDSDDFLDRDACELVEAAFTAEHCDIMVFGAELEPRDSRVPQWITKALNPRSVTYGSFVPTLLFDEATTPFVWRCAFAKSFLDREQLAFDESVRFGEDQVFLFSAYPASTKTVLCEAKPYHYRVARPESLMGTKAATDADRLANHQEIVARIARAWTDKGWLPAYEAPLLQWTIEFLLPDIVHADSEIGRRLLPIMTTTLHNYFSLVGPLMASHSAEGLLLAAIAKCARLGGSPSRLRPQLAAYLLARRGIAWAFARALRCLHR
jgi:glycosyltransferase involved in cell wall biosynthesis